MKVAILDIEARLVVCIHCQISRNWINTCGFLLLMKIQQHVFNEYYSF